MTVTLLQPYQGSPAGAVVTYAASTEAALIAQQRATTALATATTTGANTSNVVTGLAAIAAGASSVVVTNPYVDASSYVVATVAQAAADGTLLRVERVVTAAGLFTIFGTANATATTLVKWAILNNVNISPGT
jgi:hypothetical protein